MFRHFEFSRTRVARAALAAALVLSALAPLAAHAASAPAATGCATGWDCPLVMPGAYVTEPSIHKDSKGNVVVCGPHGVPSESSLWRLDAGSRQFVPFDPVPSAPFGGGDCDFAIDARDRVTMIDLWLADTSIAVSEDEQHWAFSSPLTFKIPVGDRQWIDAAGDGIVYITWRNLVDGVYTAKSTDGGHTFLPEVLVSATATIGGNLVVDRTDPTSNTVYQAWAENRVSQNALGEVAAVIDNVHLSSSTDGGLLWHDEIVRVGHHQVGNFFPVVALDTAGNPYVAWGEKNAAGSLTIYVSYRLKDSTTWSDAIPVNQDPATTNLFPWIVAGDPGRVALAWYGADFVGDPQTPHQDWFLHVAQSVDLYAPSPTFTDEKLEKIKHDDFICTKGTLCVADGLDSPGRELGDFLTIDKDATGAAIVAYNSNVTGAYDTRFVHQACGASLFAAVATLPCDPLGVPPAPVPTPLAGAFYFSGVEPVNVADSLLPGGDALTPNAPTGLAPKVADNFGPVHGSNAGTIYDAHWFLDAPANGFSFTDDTVTVHLWVTAAGADGGATRAVVALYDASTASFNPIGTGVVAQSSVTIPATPTPTEVVVTFAHVTGTLTSGLEVFVDTDAADTSDLQIYYDAALTPSRVEVA